MSDWKYLDSGPNSASVNMSLDQELLHAAAAGEERLSVLRLYTWRPPAVSIGRFQNIEGAVRTDECTRRGIDIIRRITGGRAVFHNRELTYSIISHNGNPFFPPDVLGTYKKIAAGLIAGLLNLGIRAEMVSRLGRHAALVKKKAKQPSCFSSPSWYEILVNGKKIVGSAQRRVPGAFLQHGSILIAYDPVLESRLIPGGGLEHQVTSIEQELGKAPAISDIKQALLRGFSDALEMHLT